MKFAESKIKDTLLTSSIVQTRRMERMRISDILSDYIMQPSSWWLKTNGHTASARRTSVNNFQGKTQVAVFAWVHSSNFYDFGGVLSWLASLSAATNGFQIQVRNSPYTKTDNAFIRVIISDAAVASLTTDTRVVLRNQWNLIGFVWQTGSNNTKIYCNSGTPVKIGTITKAIPASLTNTLYVSSESTSPYRGKIKKVRLFVNPDAMPSDSDVQAMYDDGHDGDGTFGGTHIWKFDDEVGLTATDSGSVGGLNLTLINNAILEYNTKQILQLQDIDVSIWYENAGEYHGASGTYPQYQNAQLIADPTAQKTWLCYGNQDTHAYATYLDWSTGEWAEPVDLGVQGGDAHGNPSMILTSDGYLIFSFASHATTATVKRTTNTRDLSSLTTGGTIATHSYGQWYEINAGTVIHLYRATGQNGLSKRTTTDHGDTWSSETVIVDLTGAHWFYVVTCASASVIHAFGTIYDPAPGTETRQHIYYLKSDDGTATWKKSDGSSYTLPIAAPEKIYDTVTDESQIHACAVDSEGNPYLLFSQGTGNSWTLKLLKLKSGVWTAYTITTHDHQWDIGTLLIYSDSDFRVIFPSTAAQSNDDGGNLKTYRSTDAGETWSEYLVLTSNETWSYNFVKAVRGHTSHCRAICSFGNSNIAATTAEKSASRLFFIKD